MNEYTYKVLSVKDALSIECKLLFDEQLQLLEKDNHTVLMAFKDSKAIGVMILSNKDKSLIIDWIYVLGFYRGEGIVTKMLELAKGYAICNKLTFICFDFMLPTPGK